ncbi:hypothetical protein A3709_02165 [Halioglobus sp. HI00S01]|uniref:TonB-dependent receptor n=1 Tax=Halioglobus sp. HI00S01 TaxID=1822214 RepID=UPI0007C373CF|nr:TonB-dependent receptor [Halioglobus sp. HI00S01]KZX58290.1 hypothetical protein A3709_02165 [Halioglobus sp. HI00S01]
MTARKRAESVQDVPIAVTAITSELKEPSIRRLEDIQGITPNVIIRNINTVPGGSSISIRGVSYQEIDKSFDPAIGVMLDGVYLGVSSGQLLNNFDIERIEVLRGPQGTLFGRNTIGGVINVIRTDPTLDWGVDASITVGSEGREDYKAVVNAPIIEDRLGIKLFANSINSDGWIHNTTLDKDVGGDDYQTYGFALLGQPTDDLSVKFHYEKNKDETDVGAWSNFNQPEDLICTLSPIPFVPWGPEQGCEAFDEGSDEEHNSMNGRNPNDTEYDTSILTVDWILGGAVLTFITGYRDQEENTVSEYDASPAPFLFLSFEQTYDQFSQEFRLATEIGDSLEVIAGVYYWESEYTQDFSTHQLFYVLDQIGSIVPGVPGGAGFTPTTIGYAEQSQDTMAWAGFLSADWFISDKWTITGGLRYTYEEKGFTGSNSVFYDPLTMSQPALTRTDLSDDWSELSPKISASYDYSEDIMLFASYAEGFKSGGYFGRNTDFSTAESYDPEFVDTFELGMKSTLFESRVIFNASVFYSDYSDKQEEVLIETAPGIVATNVVNAATVDIFGVDLELQAQLTESLSLRAAYGYLDAEYDDFVADLNGDAIATDNSGLIVRNAPENTFGLSTTYTRTIGPGDFSAYLSYRYQDQIETILNNDPLGTIDSIENLDLTLSYAWADYRITAFGRNLTDEVYARRVRIEPLVTFGQYTQGTNYGVEFSLSF